MTETINSKNLNLRMNLKEFANFTVMKRKNENKLSRKNEFVNTAFKSKIPNKKNKKNSSKSDQNDYDRFKPKESEVKEQSNENSRNRFLLKE